MPRRLAGTLLTAYVLVGAVATLSPFSDPPLLSTVFAPLDVITGLTQTQGIRPVEPVANVLLFIPVSLLLCWTFPRMSRWGVWLVCVVASAAVETAQALFLPYRISSLADLATNSGGAAVGLLLHVVITRRGGHTAGERRERMSE